MEWSSGVSLVGALERQITSVDHRRPRPRPRPRPCDGNAAELAAAPPWIQGICIHQKITDTSFGSWHNAIHRISTRPKVFQESSAWNWTPQRQQQENGGSKEVYMHTWRNPYMHACIRTPMHLCTHAYIHTCMHAYVHTHIPRHACMHVCMYVCITVHRALEGRSVPATYT